MHERFRSYFYKYDFCKNLKDTHYVHQFDKVNVWSPHHELLACVKLENAKRNNTPNLIRRTIKEYLPKSKPIKYFYPYILKYDINMEGYRYLTFLDVVKTQDNIYWFDSLALFQPFKLQTWIFLLFLFGFYAVFLKIHRIPQTALVLFGILIEQGVNVISRGYKAKAFVIVIAT